MTDRELLEAAAKAAGVNAEVHSELGFEADRGLWIKGSHGGYWNPLTSSGDALELAVTLRMGVTHNDPRDQRGYVMADCATFAGGFRSFTETEEVEDEFQRPAATRRAITRCAASLAHTTPQIGAKP